MRTKIIIALGAVAGPLLLRNLYVILFNIPDEMEQGPIYRIFYYHLPAFLTAACCYLASLIGSVRIRSPQALNTALHTAGATGGSTGSPSPVGGKSLWMKCRSMRGSEPMRRSG